MIGSGLFQSILSNDPLDLQFHNNKYLNMVKYFCMRPDATETLDTDSILLNGGVPHRDSTGENLSNVTVKIRSTQSSLLLVVVVQPHWPQLILSVLDGVQGFIV